MSRPTPETVTHALALALTAGIGSWLLAAQHPDPPLMPAVSRTIEVALEPEPAPAAAQPAAAVPPKVARPIVHREVRSLPSAPLMAAVVTAPADDSPAEAAASDPTVEVPPPMRLASGTLDAQYAATLRSNIDSRTAAPATAEYRLQKPHGEVRVNFMLDRSGSMISSELVRSSGSRLLDHHALEIVQSGHYPPFPETAFLGESRHSFLITLEFHS